MKDKSEKIENINKFYLEAFPFEDKKTDTQGFLVIIEKELMIYFRGTEVEKKQDWITDIKCNQLVYPYNNVNSKIKVHNGFITAYKSVRGYVHNFIKMNRNNIEKITVLGHSLGGALAILCSIDIQYNFSEYSKELFVYTYGAPKVGNKEFVESYNKRMLNKNRIYLRNDVVPKLPPLTNYKHVGISYAIGPWNPIIGIINLIKRKFKADCLAADLFNHSNELYEKYLKKR